MKKIFEQIDERCKLASCVLTSEVTELKERIVKTYLNEYNKKILLVNHGSTFIGTMTPFSDIDFYVSGISSYREYFQFLSVIRKKMYSILDLEKEVSLKGGIKLITTIHVKLGIGVDFSLKIPTNSVEKMQNEILVQKKNWYYKKRIRESEIYRLGIIFLKYFVTRCISKRFGEDQKYFPNGYFYQCIWDKPYVHFSFGQSLLSVCETIDQITVREQDIVFDYCTEKYLTFVFHDDSALDWVKQNFRALKEILESGDFHELECKSDIKNSKKHFNNVDYRKCLDLLKEEKSVDIVTNYLEEQNVN